MAALPRAVRLAQTVKLRGQVSDSKLLCQKFCRQKNTFKNENLCDFSGMMKHHKKKSQFVKEGKKTHLHNQSNAPQLGLHSHPASLQSNSQLKQQPHQPSPAGFIIPPVAPLESSQLLEASFESLPSFGQPHMHLSHHAGNPSSPAPPHLNTHPAGPASPETHPFLNQQPILPSPGKSRVFCIFMIVMHNFTL